MFWGRKHLPITKTPTPRKSQQLLKKAHNRLEARKSNVTYLESLAHLCPLRRILIPRPFGAIGRRECIVDLFECAFEVKDVLGVSAENVRL